MLITSEKIKLSMITVLHIVFTHLQYIYIIKYYII